MRKSMFSWGLAPLSACALLLARPVSAQTTTFTATGWINGVQSPPIVCTNALGQVLVRGSLHTARVQATDPRVTGQVSIFSEGVYNSGGAADMQGMSYLQVGTWDPAGTNFTPSGGLWEWRWNGVLQLDNSLQLKLVGYGSGGTIDGLRTEQTVTRAKAASPLDPTVPYLYTGVIKPLPVNTTLYTEDFSGGLRGWGSYYDPPPPGSATLKVSNQQLALHADFRGVPGPDAVLSSYWVYAPSATWSLADGKTLEAQVDLVSISPDAANWAFLWVGTGSECYIFAVSPHAASLLEWTEALGNTSTEFWRDDNVQLPNTNLTMRLAISRDSQNAVITTRLLDKNATNTVLFERGFVHTPQMAPGPPILSGKDKGLAVYQVSDGSLPPIDGVFDNFSLRLHDEPPLSIAHAVQLTWPGVGSYAVEAGPTPQGPWLRVQDQTIPGIRATTVPANSPAQFFHLIQAP